MSHNTFYDDKLAVFDDEVLASIFDDEKLARIVAAAGHTSDQIDLDTLRLQLETCVELYAFADSSSDYKQIRDKASRARTTTETLLTLLRDETLRKEAGPVLLVSLKAFYNRLDPKRLEIKAKEFIKYTKGLVKITSSPTGGLVGSWLPQVYEDIFKQPATSYEPPDGGPPDTPYVRFACQVAGEMGIKKCSPFTVDKALAHYRQGKTKKLTTG